MSAGALIPFIVWPDALSLFKEMTDQVTKHGYMFNCRRQSPNSAAELQSFIEHIYEVDGLRPWLIERKKKLVGSGSPREIGIFYFLPKKPRFYVRFGSKLDEQGIIYKSVVDLKMKLRNHFSLRHGLDFDAVVHSADNPYSSRNQILLIENFINSRD